MGGADVIMSIPGAGGGLVGRLDERDPVALVGIAAASTSELPPGHLVVAREVHDGSGGRRRLLPMAPVVAGELGKAGLAVHLGALVSPPSPAGRSHGPVLSGTGSVVVDRHSASVLERLPSRALTVLHAISHPGHGGAGDGGPVMASLLAARSPLERWARACGAHEIVLAAPRSFCAGVDRAIEIVVRALERYGPPVYVRRQIVHNLHVVRDLESRGAVFVEELDEVPPDATVVFAAHGVSPTVRAEADARGDLHVIDATCPLVAKVHTEARRYAAHDHSLVLVGHAGHEEIEGTLGEAPDRFHLVETLEDVERLDLDPGSPAAYLTQTTLATDETAEIIAALRRRFPTIVAPPAADICYATQNRQEGVRAIARRCDLMLVVGSENSSNTARLVEVARREGCAAELIEDASKLQLGWLSGVRTIGVTAGASAPDFLVHEVVDTLALLGPVSVAEETATTETVHFALPTQVR